MGQSISFRNAARVSAGSAAEHGNGTEREQHTEPRKIVAALLGYIGSAAANTQRARRSPRGRVGELSAVESKRDAQRAAPQVSPRRTQATSRVGPSATSGGTVNLHFSPGRRGSADGRRSRRAGSRATADRRAGRCADGCVRRPGPGSGDRAPPGRGYTDAAAVRSRRRRAQAQRSCRGYITATRSEMCLTTERSCAMKSRVRFIFRIRSASRFRICAWIDTSSADTGSSAMMIFGSRASARAIAIRCRCPPENSCGWLPHGPRRQLRRRASAWPRGR